MIGKIYIVPTPIGNLEDMTFRGVKVLREVDLIAAEDTRTSAYLCKYYNISTPMKSYHKFNEKKATDYFINFVKEGKDLAVITDAGTPGISDPLDFLVQKAIDENIQIVPLPGATALIPALVASSATKKSFAFYGFLPSKKKHVKVFLEKLKNQNLTMIFYESPHRLLTTLEIMKDIFNDRKLTLAKEISKKFEHFYYGNVDELLLQLRAKTIKGEWVIIVDGYENKKVGEKKLDFDIKNTILSLLSDDYSMKDIVEKIAKENELNKSYVYSLAREILKGVE